VGAITWGSLTNITVTDGVVESTNTDASAMSSQTIAATDAHVEFTIDQDDAEIVVGLTDDSGATYEARIQTAVVETVAYASAYNHAGYVDDVTYETGDEFKIAIVGSNVVFSK